MDSSIAPQLIVIHFFIIFVAYSMITMIIRYIILSDYFQKKTGYVLFYKNKNGKKLPVDNLAVIFIALVPSMFALSLLTVGIMYQIEFVTTNAIGLELLTIYFTTLTYLRKKYYPFIDEEKDLRKRKFFNDYMGAIVHPGFLEYPIKKYEGKFVAEYLTVSGMNTLFILILYMFIIMYILIPAKILLITIALLFIYMHVLLFPDYLNKHMSYDIRTQDGLITCYRIFGFILLIGVCSLTLINIALSG